jgi:hypothetical protein
LTVPALPVWSLISSVEITQLLLFVFFSFWSFFIMLLCSICECSIERGVENDLVMPTCDACAEFEMADEWDGQPDEAQEWADFDPDC